MMRNARGTEGQRESGGYNAELALRLPTVAAVAVIMARSRRTLGGTKLGILILALLALPVAASGQDAATSLEELFRSGELRRGDGVYITDPDGRRVKTDVTDVSPSLLTVTDGQDTWTLSEMEVSKIERRDSLQNGIWIGMAAGVGTLVAICNSRGGWLKISDDECPYIVQHWGIPGVAATAIAGAIVDAHITKTLYESPGAARLSVAPLLARERIGAQLSVGW